MTSVALLMFKAYGAIFPKLQISVDPVNALQELFVQYKDMTLTGSATLEMTISTQGPALVAWFQLTKVAEVSIRSESESISQCLGKGYDMAVLRGLPV